MAFAVVVATALTTAPSFIADNEPAPQVVAPEPTAWPTLEPAPLPTSEPTALPTTEPTATAVPRSTASRFERLIRPFLDESRRRRQAAAAADPSYWTRVDPRLNDTRLNFLLYGYGETHEPPLTERALIGSFTIFSYDYRSQSIDLVSLTHDIRAPEAERLLKSRGVQQVGPIKIDNTYQFGGFALMRHTLEDATGLAIDFEVTFDEDAIAGATDRVFGGLDVDVPLPFAVNAFYYQGKKYPAGSFGQGQQRLNGLQVIQFIKTVPVEEHYDARLEHNARKHQVFRALMDSLEHNVGDVAFLGRAAFFFGGEVASSAISYDFDLKNLLVENLWGMITDRGGDSGTSAVPRVARTIYIVDPASGDGGVQWVKANAKTNPVTQRDLDAGFYPETAIEVPYHGDPYAEDLVANYWRDVRQVILTRLTH